MKGLILIIVICFLSKTYAQQFSESEIRVFNAKEIVFLGYDFSHFKLAEIKRLNEENQEKYIPAWIGFLNERRTAEKYAAQLVKSNVVFDFEHTLNVAKNYDGKNMIVMDKHDIDEDSIQSIVDNIRSKHQKGIGLVIIPECFVKTNKTASLYFVWYDLASKEVLMSNYYARNEADGYGMANYWGQAMHAIIGYYTNDIYKKNLKRYLSGKSRVKPTKWELH